MKKIYITPSLAIVKINDKAHLLAGVSGDTAHAETLNNGSLGAKGGSFDFEYEDDDEGEW